jgi:hypothetical protein
MDTRPTTTIEQEVRDTRNKYPALGPLVRIWRLLDECDVQAAMAAGLPAEAARVMAGATRSRWAPCVALPLAADHGFEPVIGWENGAGICNVSIKSLRLAEARGLGLPVYRGAAQANSRPRVVFPLCQLVRWSEEHLGWVRREGW